MPNTNREWSSWALIAVNYRPQSTLSMLVPCKFSTGYGVSSDVIEAGSPIYWDMFDPHTNTSCMVLRAVAFGLAKPPIGERAWLKIAQWLVPQEMSTTFWLRRPKIIAGSF